MILINSKGIAIVSKKIQLPKVWDAIQKNYYYESYQIRLKNATKIKRWWRRASGFHDFKLIEPYLVIINPHVHILLIYLPYYYIV